MNDSATAPTLTPGANISLPSSADGSWGTARLTLTWRPDDLEVDADISALLLGSDGRVRCDEDLVFYNAPATPDGSVRHRGKVEDDGLIRDRIEVDLGSLEHDVERVVVAASLDAADGVGFGVLGALELTLQDADERLIASFPISSASSETAFVFGELYRRAGAWKLRAVGQGYDSGLAGLATDFGIEVDDDTDDAGEPTAEAPDEHDDIPLQVDLARETTAPAPLQQQQQQVNAQPTAILDRGQPQVHGRAPRSPKVSTRKRKGRVVLAPAPTLALDESWTPSRLFSIYGIGAGDEQEKRATSALLSVAMMVRPFGRALTGKLGAPAGPIETFLEVGFAHGESTVYPDGVVRVARGARTWTCLVEVKTGAGALRKEQLEAYLDVAREHGFDCVLSISNEMPTGAGAHPVPVDKRKTRKVALHHLSWAEILHESRMLYQHRGLEETHHAWMLHELIRYLEHPRSGAAGFTDMGSAWVPVRDAVAAGTLRASEKRARDVAASWDRLARHVCMRLTGSLGVEVRQVTPRKLASDPAARDAAVASQLAATGQLSVALRVPDAVGPMSVVADLRTGQVEVSVELDAPREGRGLTRVNWLLRQLKDAPEGLRVEAVLPRRAETVCELLKDVRTNPALLLPEPGAEPRSFRLTMTSPAGTKRGTGRGAFITSVESAVETFYSEVNQQLRAWAPPAPKMTSELDPAGQEDVSA